MGTPRGHPPPTPVLTQHGRVALVHGEGGGGRRRSLHGRGARGGGRGTGDRGWCAVVAPDGCHLPWGWWGSGPRLASLSAAGPRDIAQGARAPAPWGLAMSPCNVPTLCPRAVSLHGAPVPRLCHDPAQRLCRVPMLSPCCPQALSHSKSPPGGCAMPPCSVPVSTCPHVGTVPCPHTASPCPVPTPCSHAMS